MKKVVKSYQWTVMEGPGRSRVGRELVLKDAENELRNFVTKSAAAGWIDEIVQCIDITKIPLETIWKNTINVGNNVVKFYRLSRVCVYVVEEEGQDKDAIKEAFKCEDIIVYGPPATFYRPLHVGRDMYVDSDPIRRVISAGEETIVMVTGEGDIDQEVLLKLTYAMHSKQVLPLKEDENLFYLNEDIDPTAHDAQKLHRAERTIYWSDHE